jgi:catechol 2,3-dioxygenase-like lactoylglutathione lyase family enzyme
VIDRLRSIELDVRDLAASERFYAEVWGLEVVARTDDAVFLRGTGSEHHIVTLRVGAVPGARRVNFGAPDRRAVDALHVRLKDVASAAPAEVREPGGGYGFTFHDPQGRAYRVLAGVAEHEPGTRIDVPIKLSHVVVASTDPEAMYAFFTPLGFRLRDRSGRIHFLGCNAEHHCLAFGRSERNRLSHVAFDLPSIDGLMKGTGRLKRQGVSLEHGVGRHGPGNNVYAYFIDPNDFVIEYTTEMEHVDDRTYVPRMPEHWDKRETSDEWGVAGPPTERFRSLSSGRHATETAPR